MTRKKGTHLWCLLQCLGLAILLMSTHLFDENTMNKKLPLLGEKIYQIPTRESKFHLYPVNLLELMGAPRAFVEQT